MKKFLTHFGALGDVLVSLPVIEAFDRAHPGEFVAFGNPERLSLLLRPWGPLDTLRDGNSREAVSLFGDLQGGQDLLEAGPWLVFGKTGSFAEKVRGRRNVVLLPAPGRDLEDKLVKDTLRDCLPESLRTLAPQWPTLNVPAQERHAVTLAPGAGAPSKRWSVENFAELGHRIHEATGLPCQILLGPVEQETMDEASLRQLFSAPFFSLLVATPPRDLALCLAASVLHIGNDSGPSHLAAAVGTKTLTLFGPSVAQHWAPCGPLGRGSVLCAEESDFKLLSLEQVWREARRLLGCSP